MRHQPLALKRAHFEIAVLRGKGVGLSFRMDSGARACIVLQGAGEVQGWTPVALKTGCSNIYGPLGIRFILATILRTYS